MPSSSPTAHRPLWSVFDPEWYLETYPDVPAKMREAGIDDPETFYRTEGAGLLHSPNPFFDEAWYRARHPVVAQMVKDGIFKSGFEHYCSDGYRDALISGHWLFKELSYRQQFIDATLWEKMQKDGIVNGYDHYLETGDREGLSGSPLFMPKLARQLFPTVRDTGRGLFYHLLRYGMKEADKGRLSWYFDPVWYLESFPAAREAIAQGHFRNALHHFMCNDTPDAFPGTKWFSEEFYLATYPDIRQAKDRGHFRLAFGHFYTFGANENRSPTAQINLMEYAARPEVKAAVDAGEFPNAFCHLIARLDASTAQAAKAAAPEASPTPQPPAPEPAPEQPQPTPEPQPAPAAAPAPEPAAEAPRAEPEPAPRPAPAAEPPAPVAPQPPAAEAAEAEPPTPVAPPTPFAPASPAPLITPRPAPIEPPMPVVAAVPVTSAPGPVPGLVMPVPRPVPGPLQPPAPSPTPSPTPGPATPRLGAGGPATPQAAAPGAGVQPPKPQPDAPQPPAPQPLASEPQPVAAQHPAPAGRRPSWESTTPKQTPEQKQAFEALTRKLGRPGFLYTRTDVLDFTPTEEPALSVVMLLDGQTDQELLALEDLRASYDGPMEVVLLNPFRKHYEERLAPSLRGVKLVQVSSPFPTTDRRNEALAHVSTPYVLFLDRRIRFAPQAVQVGLAHMQQNAQTAILAPRIIKDARRVLNAGYIVQHSGAVVPYIPDVSPHSGDANRLRDIHACSFLCVMMRTAIFEEVKGFDPAFSSLSLREADLCRRVRGTGRKCVYNPAFLTGVVPDDSQPLYLPLSESHRLYEQELFRRRH